MRPGTQGPPTQKPEALLTRVLLAASNAGDLVLDPFFGSGTTGVAARRLGRSFIGIDGDPVYAKAARRRIDAVEPLAEGAVATAPTRRSEPRVAFASVVEAGLARPGERLVDAGRRHSAVVRADGALAVGAAVGSDPQDRRAGAGPAGLQRLDVLAYRARRPANSD